MAECKGGSEWTSEGELNGSERQKAGRPEKVSKRYKTEPVSVINDRTGTMRDVS